MAATIDQQNVAKAFLAARAEKTPLTQYPGTMPRTMGEAYAIQDAFVEAKARECGEPIGWKIALSNPAMQRFVGLDRLVEEVC